jgi:hypothetical protein
MRWGYIDAGELRYKIKWQAYGQDGDSLHQLLKVQIILDNYWLLRMVQDFLKDHLTQTKKDSQKRKKYPG